MLQCHLVTMLCISSIVNLALAKVHVYTFAYALFSSKHNNLEWFVKKKQLPFPSLALILLSSQHLQAPPCISSD